MKYSGCSVRSLNFDQNLNVFQLVSVLGIQVKNSKFFCLTWSRGVSPCSCATLYLAEGLRELQPLFWRVILSSSLELCSTKSRCLECMVFHFCHPNWVRFLNSTFEFPLPEPMFVKYIPHKAAAVTGSTILVSPL